MGAALEPVVYVLRAGPEFEKHGDPWVSTATVLVTGDTAWISGLRSEDVWIGRSQAVKELKARGVRVIRGTRIRNGKTRQVEVRL